MKTTYTVLIDAGVDHVFRWLTQPDCVRQWLSSLVEHRALTTTPDRTGSTFRQVYRGKRRNANLHGAITVFEPNRRLGVRLSGRGFDLSVEYLLEDLNRQTQLTQQATVRFRSFMVLLAPVLAPGIRRSSLRQLSEDFARLKELCETDVPLIRRAAGVSRPVRSAITN